VSSYEYQPTRIEPDAAIALDKLRARIPNRLATGYVPAIDPQAIEKLEAGFGDMSIPIAMFQVNADDYRAYFAEAAYPERYPLYYPTNLVEKSFEHFVSTRLLAIRPGETFIDIASEGSPLPDILHRIAGARCYAQDIMYANGVQGYQIGGDACEMPVHDRFATAAALTCSLEHFEADSDIRLFAELGRVLAPGGRFSVIPLYLYPELAAQTDPRYSATCDVPFDAGATVFCADGWGNRHGRFYDAAALQTRLLAPFRDIFDFTLFRLHNTAAISPAIYARWALLAERR
jgi:SAM-dependent methyltransferase